MFLTPSREQSMLDIASKQFQYKLRSYFDIFISLMIVQLIGVLFSFNGVGSMSSSFANLTFQIRTISNEIIIVFAMIWMFSIAIKFSTKMYRDVDFAFVSNRTTSTISSIAVLVTIGVVTGITTSLLGILLRVISFFYLGADAMSYQYFYLSPQELLMSALSNTLYVILVAAIGYFFGMLVQWNKIFIVLLPTFVIGMLILEARQGGSHSLTYKVIEFFIYESSIAVFALKVIVTASILFFTTIILSKRLEVRR
ncbi:hypothetical protein BHU72_05560 [Desulfuribacillus stibiiarsenatis]|uniref:Uncharacterized protein n=1 Tax=Desulfuribacillus stibiiarsenatis TaxID=1390249 RepID=A0A1E5L4T7_9FIRM|nr:hypothetical protein [Desulfuribacillus stibiiarsenatis]OEH85078.1 hypothetical protein BHU72_05560 [Desulfuribacillus stibiiarsenatis]